MATSPRSCAPASTTGTTHILTIALDDRDQFVPADEPEPNPELLTAFDDTPPPVRTRGDLPSVYDGIYRAAYSYGMSAPMTKQLIRLLASDVDFQSRLNPTDRLEVFFSQPDGDDQMSDEFRAALRVGHVRRQRRATSTVSRCRTAASTISTRKAAAPSSSCCATRCRTASSAPASACARHPILGYVKMHTGVDWAAPTGTPILAAGNGVIEKAGWAGGYGRQTIIRHANGYETSYNHQSAFANGVEPGARSGRAR